MGRQGEPPTASPMCRYAVRSRVRNNRSIRYVAVVHYWDFQTLMAAAPAAWHQRLDTADLSWVYDATGIA